jgi:hypothetical protein
MGASTSKQGLEDDENPISLLSLIIEDYHRRPKPVIDGGSFAALPTVDVSDSAAPPERQGGALVLYAAQPLEKIVRPIGGRLRRPWRRIELLIDLRPHELTLVPRRFRSRKRQNDQRCWPR